MPDADRASAVRAGYIWLCRDELQVLAAGQDDLELAASITALCFLQEDGTVPRDFAPLPPGLVCRLQRSAAHGPLTVSPEGELRVSPVLAMRADEGRLRRAPRGFDYWLLNGELWHEIWCDNPRAKWHALGRLVRLMPMVNRHTNLLCSKPSVKTTALCGALHWDEVMGQTGSDVFGVWSVGYYDGARRQPVLESDENGHVALSPTLYRYRASTACAKTERLFRA